MEVSGATPLQSLFEFHFREDAVSAALCACLMHAQCLCFCAGSQGRGQGLSVRERPSVRV